MKLNHNFSALDYATLALAMAMLIATFKLPYSYYTLLRFATFIIAGCWAFVAYGRGKKPLMVAAGAVALLFQPFVKIVLDKTAWVAIDWLLAIVILGYFGWLTFLKK